MQLRYPILILALLYSFNVKAETYVCALDSPSGGVPNNILQDIDIINI